jgi:hypothetical protein
MNHTDALSRLPDLLGMHPASPDEVALRAHVADCADCQSRLATLERLQAELGRFANEDPSTDLDARILAIPTLDTEERSAPTALPPRRIARRRIWIPAAAATLVAVLVMAFTFTRGDPGQTFVAEHTVAMTSEMPRVSAEIAMGRADGSNQPVRLKARGLSTTDAGFYTLWVIDDQHHAMSAATFRPEDDGTCIVMGVVPRNITWKQAAITMGDTPPTDTTMLAVGQF